MNATRALIAALILSFSSVIAAFAQTVDLAFLRTADPLGGQGESQGSAWLFNRGGVCYALTPAHILKSETRDDRYASMVIVRPGRDPIQAQADRCAIIPRSDIALLRVTGVADLRNCGTVLTAEPSIDGELARSSSAAMMTATEAGSFNRSTLSVRSVQASDPDHIIVAPAAARDRITEGMSGSHVTLADRPAGFLLSVLVDEDGAAKVLRRDRAIPMLQRLFDNPSGAQLDDPTCLRHPAAAQPRAEPLSNLAAASCGARVLSWSRQPTAPEFRPENLIDGAAETTWKSTISGDGFIDIALCPSQGRIVRNVSIAADSCEASASSVQIEALLGSGNGATFVSAGHGALPISGRAFEQSLGAGLIGDTLRLRFVGPARPYPVCLSNVSVR